MIDPATVVVLTPTFDDSNCSGYTDGLAACAAFGYFVTRFKIAGTGIRLSRNILAHSFLKSKFEWAVWIDADIEFTPLDFALLCDYPTQKPMPYPDVGLVESASTLQGEEMKFSANFVPNITETADALISTAEYSRKVETLDAVRFGLGFTRMHRSVFEKIDAVNNEDGSAKVDNFPYKGQLVQDYFLEGALTHHWYGEDQGFFALVQLAGITPKIEQRTGLIHHGRKAYPYFPAVAQ